MCVGLPPGNISWSASGVWISLSIIIHDLIDSFLRCGNLNHYWTSILVLHQGTVIENLISLNLTVGKRFSKRLSDSFHSAVMRQASHLSVGKLLCHCLCWPNTNSQTYYTWYMCMLRLHFRQIRVVWHCAWHRNYVFGLSRLCVSPTYVIQHSLQSHWIFQVCCIMC